MKAPLVPALALMLLAIALGGLAQSEPKDAVQYDIFIACPAATNGACPVQAWDGADALGSPALAVDPDNVDNMIFASLHGRDADDFSDDEAPEDRSRRGQQYTTHTSTNHGASWVDSPFSQPRDLPSDATGEHPGIALDPYGHVFISSLYALPVEDNGTAWDYVIAAQKFASLSDIRSSQNGEYNVRYVDSVYPFNRIGETWFSYDIESDHVVLLWNEQVTPDSMPAAPGQADGGVAGTALREVLRRAPAAAGAMDAPRGAIGWAWTTADVSDPYHVAPRSSIIAPCSTSTNPVVSEGWLYVGCVVGKGTPEWDPTAETGDIHLFRFRPNGGEPQHLGASPLSGGAPKLGVRSDGRIALMTTEVVDPDGVPRIRLDGAYGQYDPDKKQVVWSGVHEYGPDLQVLYANMPLVETNIQDMIYREYSGVIHMIFKRVADWPPAPDAAYRPEFFKAIVAIDEHYGVLKEMDLGIGDLRHRQMDQTLYRQDPYLYNDVADDFLELPPAPFRYENRPLGHSYQREFYAVGNYGLVDFAEIIEVTELRGPAAPGLPDPVPPPDPSPASSSSLALGTAGALTASAVAAGTWATAKRKSATGAKKK